VVSLTWYAKKKKNCRGVQAPMPKVLRGPPVLNGRCVVEVPENSSENLKS
jgi:hypothetical protein